MLKKHNIRFFDVHLIPALMDKNPILQISFSSLFQEISLK